MSNNNNRQLGEAPWFHVILSTGFGVGFIPGAPGTYAAFMAWGCCISSTVSLPFSG